MVLGLGLFLVWIQPSLADATWEHLGPDLGFGDFDAFFVTEQALYIGQSEEIDTGFGLHRYRFDEGEWDLVGFDGHLIFGIVVWGESDENILLRTWDGSDPITWRSTNGGESWTATVGA